MEFVERYPMDVIKKSLGDTFIMTFYGHPENYHYHYYLRF